MKSKVFAKRVFSLKLSEEELSVIAGALYSFDEVAELQGKIK